MITLNEYFSHRNKVLAIAIFVFSFTGFMDDVRTGLMSVSLIAIIFFVRLTMLKIKLGNDSISIYTYYNISYKSLEFVKLIQKTEYKTVLLRKNSGKLFAFSLSNKDFELFKSHLFSNQSISETFKEGLAQSLI